MANTPNRDSNMKDLFFTSHRSPVDKCVSIPSVGDIETVLFDIFITFQYIKKA